MNNEQKIQPQQELINLYEQIIQLQQELIDLYETQIADLTVMSKIELGDDVIEEIKRLKSLLNNGKR